MKEETRENTLLIAPNEYSNEILNRLPAAVYSCDLTGRITYFNDAAVQLWGRTPIIGQDCWCGSLKVFRSDGSVMPLDEYPIAKALREQRAASEEVILERPDGQRLHVKPNPEPMYDADGQLVGALNLLIDITEQKKSDATVAERRRNQLELSEQLEIKVGTRTQKLKQSEDRYFKMIEEVEDYAIILLDADGTILNWNRGAEKIKGYSEEDAIGQNFRIFYLPEDRKAKLPERLIEEARITGKATHEGWRMRKGGTTFWGSVVITALHDNYNEVIGFSKVTRDLTLQKKAEDQLREYALDIEIRNSQLERYHKMVEEVEDYAIIMLDCAGTIQNWNRGAQKIKGYTEKEILGKNFSIFYLPEDRQKGLPQDLIKEAHDHGKATHEGWRVRKDGSKFWGSIVITALHDDKNRVIGFSKVTRDLTERKEIEDQLQNYARNIEFRNTQLEEYAYIASHDLQEPLRKIQIFADLLQTNIHDDEAVKRNIEKINSAANRMTILIRDVLQYSQLSSPDELADEVDLNIILNNVLADFDLLIEEKNVTVNRTKLPIVKGIAVQLHQLFGNLISNSIKFSENVPIINISANIFTGDISEFPNLDHNCRYVQILFKDNGVGFEQQHAHMVFKMFKRLGGVGTGSGIGLAMCKKIVENHHGAIEVSSEPGKGTTFKILLPVSEN